MSLIKSLAALSLLPLQPTPFVGREEDTAKILAVFADPACRLMTLVGPGGIGKTRLALQVAHQLNRRFPDGVVFVALQGVDSQAFLLPAIAERVGLALSGSQPPMEQLTSYLADRRLLLLLDNFEQLLDSADMLTVILDQTPNVGLLVTSREVLNLRQEWIWTVGGLNYPTDPHDPNAGSFGAVRLFADCARRAQPGFSLAANLADVIRICQMVDGMPLALELAATWLKMLPCGVIADEIEHSLDFLKTNLRDLPPRHRNIRAVFDQSWRLLPEPEREVFKRLSVFRGGFTVEAARAIAGASLPLLAALLDKSLIRREASGRHQIHELLRQYAHEQLAEQPADVRALEATHATYFADYLHQRYLDMLGRRQRDATHEITDELDNIRAAWSCLCATGDISALHHALPALAMYFQVKGRFLEGTAALEQARDTVEAGHDSQLKEATRLALMGELAWLYIRLGKLGEAERCANEAEAIRQQIGMQPDGHGSDPLNILSIIANVRGSHALSAQLAGEAYRRSEPLGQTWNMQIAAFMMGRAAYVQGDYDGARRHLQHSYTLTRETGDAWYRGYVLLALGDVERALGRYSEAQAYYQESFNLRQQFDDPEGSALALRHMGQAAVKQRDFVRAEALFQQSLTTYQQLGDLGGLALVLEGLGDCAAGQGDYARALHCYADALNRTVQAALLPYSLSILSGVARVLFDIGEHDESMELTAYILQHPGTEQEVRQQIKRWMDAHSLYPSPQIEAAVEARWLKGSFEVFAVVLQERLRQRMEGSGAPAPHRKAAHALPDPLTEREHEILRLLAQGATNHEIAEQLTLVVGTVKAHNHSIFSKLGVKNRVQAITRARELNLLG